MLNIIASAVAFAVLILLSVTFIGIWVYKDAKQRGLSAGMWVLIVVLSGNIIGLILYLVIGRKQGRSFCGHCGASANTQDTFCPACGEKIILQQKEFKSHKGFLIACVLCIVLAFVSIGLLLLSIFNSEGFMIQNKYSYYTANFSGSAKNVVQKSSGDEWALSFEEASEGYSFNTTYNAATKPSWLSLDVDCHGTVQILVTQYGVLIDETIENGSYGFDMAKFEAGAIKVKIINMDAYNFKGKMKITS